MELIQLYPVTIWSRKTRWSNPSRAFFGGRHSWIGRGSKWARQKRVNFQIPKSWSLFVQMDQATWHLVRITLGSGVKTLGFGCLSQHHDTPYVLPIGPLGLATVIDVSFQHWLYKRRPVGQEFMEHIWTNSGIPPEPLVSWPSKRLGSQVFVLTTSASEKHRADAARMRGDYSGCLSGVTMLVAETPRLANSQIVIGFIANSNQFLGDEDDRTNPCWASRQWIWHWLVP